MLRRTVPQDFWHGDREVGRNFTAGQIGGYYNDLTAKAQPFSGPQSPLGVPLERLRPGSYALHPVTVCQVALGWHERWISEKSDGHLEQFLMLTDWLVHNQCSRFGVGGVWPVPYPVDVYRLPAGWISALVQGQAVSALVRAYRATGNVKYLAAAEAAIAPFEVEVSQGGLRNYDDEGNLFFEEYPTASPSRVLNGFISSLWGLYDFAICTGNCLVQTMFADGMRTLRTSLHLYDMGYWSRYSLFHSRGFSNVASPYYHKEHIAQLRATHLLTDDASLARVADRWEKYQRSWVNLSRVVSRKAVSRFYLWLQRKVSDHL